MPLSDKLPKTKTDKEESNSFSSAFSNDFNLFMGDQQFFEMMTADERTLTTDIDTQQTITDQSASQNNNALSVQNEETWQADLITLLENEEMNQPNVSTDPSQIPVEETVTTQTNIPENESSPLFIFDEIEQAQTIAENEKQQSIANEAEKIRLEERGLTYDKENSGKIISKITVATRKYKRELVDDCKNPGSKIKKGSLKERQRRNQPHFDEENNEWVTKGYLEDKKYREKLVKDNDGSLIPKKEVIKRKRTIKSEVDPESEGNLISKQTLAQRKDSRKQVLDVVTGEMITKGALRMRKQRRKKAELEKQSKGQPKTTSQISIMEKQNNRIHEISTTSSSQQDKAVGADSAQASNVLEVNSQTNDEDFFFDMLPISRWSPTLFNQEVTPQPSQKDHDPNDFNFSM